jgi:alpha-1,6-mannosyltransferase
VPPSHSSLAPARPRSAPARSVVRIADVAVWYGARSGGIRTYLDAKARFAATTGALEHHLVVPAARERHTRGRHELPGVLVERTNGYRLPTNVRPLLRTLRAIQPDVVLLHDSHWWPATVVHYARTLGAAVVAVHHASAEGAAIGKPGPEAGWRAALSAWQRRLYRRVDAVMAAAPLDAETTDAPVIPLRFGLDPSFRPGLDQPRRTHVLYVGRLSAEKGIELLLQATASGPGPGSLRLVGCGPAQRQLRRQAERLGIAARVEFAPFIPDPGALRDEYAQAACVVVPGGHETFGLVAVEAAASGARVVASSAVPSALLARDLIHTFAPGNPASLADAIARASAATPDALSALRLARRLTWTHAFEAELADLEALPR